MLGVFREVAATAYGFCDLDKTQRPVEANMTRVVKLLEGSLFTFKVRVQSASKAESI